MQAALAYQWLADTVLIAHFVIVMFVVGGLLLVVAGNLLAWPWVNSTSFRMTHLAAIAVVVAESWLGITCPLTTLESWLRTKAGTGSYSGSFIEHWLQQLLFYEAPWWAFAITYSVFGLLVAVVWWYFPPKPGKPQNESNT